MKLRKHAAIAAVSFMAAMNTACGLYGPPAEDREPPARQLEESAYAQTADTAEAVTAETESADEASHEA